MDLLGPSLGSLGPLSGLLLGLLLEYIVTASGFLGHFWDHLGLSCDRGGWIVLCGRCTKVSSLISAVLSSSDS